MRTFALQRDGLLNKRISFMSFFLLLANPFRQDKLVDATGMKEKIKRPSCIGARGRPLRVLPPLFTFNYIEARQVRRMTVYTLTLLRAHPSSPTAMFRRRLRMYSIPFRLHACTNLRLLSKPKTGLLVPHHGICQQDNTGINFGKHDFCPINTCGM